MLPWEIALRLAQKITGRNDALRSSLFERTDGEVYQSATDGRLSLISLTTSALVRGGSSSTYPIRLSLDAFFDFYNAFEPIGLGIEYINDEPYVVIEPMDYFYNSTDDALITFANPTGLKTVTNPERIYGKVLTGFRNFEKASETVAGADTFISAVHTKRSYTTRLDNKSNQTYNVRTNAIASPYLIEIVRNNPLSNNTSDETNGLFFHVVVKRSGGSFIVDNDYVSVTGISDPGTQKNYLITPGRTVLNHLKVINCALIREYKRREALGQEFKPIRVQSGDGNYTASSRIGSEDAEIAENAALSAGVEPIYLEDDLIIDTAITESDYIDLMDNLTKRIKVTFDGVTYHGYIDEIKFNDLNKLTCRAKLANDDY
jgi:hypothetical protein